MIPCQENFYCAIVKIYLNLFDIMLITTRSFQRIK